MSNLFRRSGIRTAADASDFGLDAAPNQPPSRQITDAVHNGAGLLLDRMLGGAGLTVAGAGRDTLVAALAGALITWRAADGRRSAAIVAQHPVRFGP